MYTVIGTDGLKYGPVNSETLQVWASTGSVTPTTLVTIHETGQQVQANQIAFLQSVLLPPVYQQPNTAQHPGIIRVQPGAHSVGTAVLLALLITGLGQIYNKQGMKGLVILLISVVLAVCTCGLSILLTHPFALIDAILIAQRLNRGEAISEWQCF
jgi:TM2 domain-containing membrane protein YozV